jgi:hypothetical protein
MLRNRRCVFQVLRPREGKSNRLKERFADSDGRGTQRWVAGPVGIAAARQEHRLKPVTTFDGEPAYVGISAAGGAILTDGLAEGTLARLQFTVGLHLKKLKTS